MRWLPGPTALAFVVTVVNAAKPVAVDDAAYLAFAREVAAHPLDPYGFDMFWYDRPEPAMGVLLPPVVPYWLGLGIALVGENPPLLKLWLFPFVWVFAWSLRDLLRRFARGAERAALPLLMLSPAVLPTVNLMLDVPAVGLGLAALAVFARACDRGVRRLAVAAGLLAGLAMQTKYTALLVPAVVGWYGLTHRRAGLASLAGGVAAAVFAGWEFLVAATYGTSHFLHHLANQQAEGTWVERIEDKWALLPGLLGGLGLLAAGVGPFAGRAVGIPRWVILSAAVLWGCCVGLISFLPPRDLPFAGTEPTKDAPFTSAAWRTAGVSALVPAAMAAGVLVVRRWRPLRVRRSRDTWFVVGWVGVELAGYFALTPFPAARRVIGPTVALGVLAARVVSRVGRARPDRRPPGWVVPLGVAAGVFTAAVDTWDAYPERVLAERAAEVIREQPRGGRVWFAGHWGFQFYCERAGMRPAPSGVTLAEGDYFVLPLYPAAEGFYRPDSVHVRLRPPADSQLVAELVWDDWLSATTIPSFYGGPNPLVGRNHPRFRVGVYRLTREAVVPEDPTP